MSAELIETAADALGPLVSDVVFLGGASIHLWISDRAAPGTRATDDVDVISAVVGKVGYYQLGDRLRERGFSEAVDSPVICRWNHAETGLVLHGTAEATTTYLAWIHRCCPVVSEE